MSRSIRCEGNETKERHRRAAKLYLRLLLLENPRRFVMLESRSTFGGAVLLVLAAYAATLAGMPKHVFWSPDEGAKFIQAETIRWSGGIEYVLPYRSVVTDPDFQFYPSRCRYNDLYPDPRRGEIRFHWPVWFPLAGRILSSWFGVTGLYLLPMVSGWLTALACGLLVRRQDPALGVPTVLIVGLATPIFFYSLCFWEHTPATLLGIVALGLLATARTGSLRVWWLAAPLLAAAIALRIEMVAFAIAAVLGWGAARWTISRRRLASQPGDRRKILLRYALTCVGFGGLAIAVFALSLMPRHWETEPLYRGLWIDTPRKAPAVFPALLSILINSPGHQAPIVPWPWSALALLALPAIAFAARMRTPLGEAVVALPALLVTVGLGAWLLLRPDPYLSLHGFVPIAPFVAFAAYGVVASLRAKEMWLLTIAVTGAVYLVLGFAAIFTFFVRSDGFYLTGLEWGARNLLTLYPIAVILSLIGLRDYLRSDRPRLLKRAMTLLVASMILVAFQFQVRGLRMLYGSRHLLSEWQQALPTGEPVVTDIWWLPAALAPFFVTHEMLCVSETAEVSRWLPAARQHRVEAFTFASLQPIDAGRVTAGSAIVESTEERFVSGLYLERFRIRGAGDGAP